MDQLDLNEELSLYEADSLHSPFGERSSWQKIAKDPHYGWDYAHCEHTLKWCLLAPSNPSTKWVWTHLPLMEGRVINLEGDTVILTKHGSRQEYIITEI